MKLNNEFYMRLTEAVRNIEDFPMEMWFHLSCYLFAKDEDNTFIDNISIMECLTPKSEQVQKMLFVEENYIEELADYAHKAWALWTAYLLSNCHVQPNGDLLLPERYVTRWERQINTAYADLSEDEQESDRREARKMTDILFGDGKYG